MYANGTAWSFSGTSYSNSNVANYLVTYTGNINANTITASIFSGNHYGNHYGNGTGITSIAGANVTGVVANATYATSAGSATAATTAGTVTTAAQPNITSVGTLTGLTVTATISGNITGNANYANTAGSTTTAATVTTNAQPNITSVGTLTSLTVSGDVTLQANSVLSIANTTQSANTISGALKVVGGIASQGNIHANHIHALYTLNAGQHLFAGNNAQGSSFQSQVMVGKDTATSYVQSAMVNSADTGSADWIAYGESGDDEQGWNDLGYTGTNFNDANYTITKASDGYIFTQGMSAQGGNLVLATGETGAVSYRDIVFATGGFLATDEKLRISHASDSLMPYANVTMNLGSNTRYYNNAFINSAVVSSIIGTGNLKLQPDVADANAYLDIFLTAGPDIHIAGNGETIILGTDDFANVTVGVDGNVYIQANTDTPKTWKFDSDGNLILPLGGIIRETSIPGGGLTGSTIALTPEGGIDADQQLLIYPTGNVDYNHLHLTSGNLYNTELYLGNDDLYIKIANTGNIVINSNDNNGNTAQWNFNADGNLILPGNTFAVNYANGTQVSIDGGGGGNSISDGTSNVTVTSADGNVVIGVDNDTMNWTFATDGIIYGKIDSDVNITVVDTEEDGFGVKQTVTDGTVAVSQTILEYDRFSIYTDLTGTAHEWRFDRDTLQVTNNSFIRAFDANIIVQSMSAGGTDVASLQSVSNQNDPNVFSTFDATPTGANIKVYDGGSSGGTEYAWQFGNDGNFTIPDAIIGTGNLTLYNYDGADESQLSLSGSGVSLYSNASIDLEANIGSNVSILTDGGNREWVFDTTGTLTTPGDIAVAGDITGTAAANTLILKAQPSTNTSIQLNSIVDSTIRIDANLEIITDSSNTSQSWNFDIAGNLTLPTSGQIIVSGGLVSSGASPAPTINGFSITNSVGISGDGNIAGGNISASGTITSTGSILTNAQIQSTLFVGGNISWSANNQTDFQGAIKVGGSGIIKSPGGASSITLNNNGANIPTATITTALNVTGASGANITANLTAGNISTGGTLTSTGKIGYASGSTVTQTTNRGNGVNINALAGTIITVSASMVAGEISVFSVTNNQVDTSNDIVLAQVVSPNLGNYNLIANPNSGVSGFYLTLQNISGFPISAEAVTIRFMVIKAPNA